MAADTSVCIGVLFDPVNVRESEFFEGVVRFAETRKWRVVTREEIFFLPHAYFPHSALSRWEGNGIVGFLRDRWFATALKRFHIPAVNTARMNADWGIPSVVPDFVAAGRMAAEYFLERGFRHFAYCVERQYPYRDFKEEGFSERVSEAGFSSAVISLPLRPSQNRAWAQYRVRLIEQLQRLPKPLAVWTRQDRLGVQVLSACEAANMAVPDQVAVMGYGDTRFVCPYTRPPLASIPVGYENIGFQAAAMLERLMRGDKKASNMVQIPPSAVVERGSADVLAPSDPELAEALRYIEQHACDPIWIENVLEHTGMNRRRLERLFQRDLRRSPNSEIVRVRVRRARQLLSETDMPLAEVAKSCGFGRYSGMTDIFKRMVGQTPRAYRKRTRSPS